MRELSLAVTRVCETLTGAGSVLSGNKHCREEEKLFDRCFADWLCTRLSSQSVLYRPFIHDYAQTGLQRLVEHFFRAVAKTNIRDFESLSERQRAIWRHVRHPQHQ